MLKAIITLIMCLPELLKLLELIEANQIEQGLDKKVKDDVKALTEAWEKGDAEAIRRVFNS